MDQNPTPAPETPVAEPVQPTAPSPSLDLSAPVAAEPAKKGGKGLAIVALICGILGLITCWVPFLGLVLAIIGVVLGIVALVKKSSKGMSIAGLVCGGIALIPAVIFSLVLGSLVAIFGGTINECINNPDSELCSVEYDYDDDYDDYDDGETCAENLWGDDCEYDSDEYWEAYCEKYPTSLYCEEEEEDENDKDYSWVDDYVTSMFKTEMGDQYDESMSLIESSKKIIVDEFTDFIVCANDNGVSIKSEQDLNDIMEMDAEDADSYNLTATQEANIEKCAQTLSDNLSSLYVDTATE